MKRIRVSPDGTGTLVDFLCIGKPAIAALLSVADKNPRTQWLWFDHESESAWAVGSNRVMRVTNTEAEATSWFRCPIKEIKALKLTVKDMLLVRRHGPDVTDLVVVRHHGTALPLNDGDVPSPVKEKVKELPGSGVAKIEPFRLSIPAEGIAAYTADKVEPMLRANSGGTVSKVVLPPEHVGSVDKMCKVLGKGSKAAVALTPGRGSVPCVWRGAQGDSQWAYALLDKDMK